MHGRREQEKPLTGQYSYHCIQAVFDNFQMIEMEGI